MDGDATSVALTLTCLWDGQLGLLFTPWDVFHGSSQHLSPQAVDVVGAERGVGADENIDIYSIPLRGQERHDAAHAHRPLLPIGICTFILTFYVKYIIFFMSKLHSKEFLL